ncbi:glycosyltransferase [Streptomyces longwoodensis]|uniref:glycosyltransferase family 2 protein n=1 Tax=Streptomyces longwoodensis TaxID=68231 RepID=UPI003F53F28C
MSVGHQEQTHGPSLRGPGGAPGREVSGAARGVSIAARAAPARRTPQASDRRGPAHRCRSRSANIVPVYNPDACIEECAASLLRQSLPRDAYEVFFVDDGSTDGTPARLDGLAAADDRVRVIHQENSGWSGRPRNVGIDAARGEYVMFVDNDDHLGDEALERMYAYGVANDADVVVGKVAGRGRSVPVELFRVNRPRATVENAPLIDSLTPHKMVGKAFLDRTGLRFPEGRRRLEDHVFVTEAYLRAGNVAVLGDYVCYYHVRRDDDANAGFQRFDPVGYFKNLREALDVVERYAEPGPLRDRLFRRWLRVEMTERLRGRRFLDLPDDYRRRLLQEIHEVIVERFGPGVAEPLQPAQRIVAELAAADRYDDGAGVRRVGVRRRAAGDTGGRRLAGRRTAGGLRRGVHPPGRADDVPRRAGQLRAVAAAGPGRSAAVAGRRHRRPVRPGRRRPVAAPPEQRRAVLPAGRRGPGDRADGRRHPGAAGRTGHRHGRPGHGGGRRPGARRPVGRVRTVRPRRLDQGRPGRSRAPARPDRAARGRGRRAGGAALLDRPAHEPGAGRRTGGPAARSRPGRAAGRGGRGRPDPGPAAAVRARPDRGAAAARPGPRRHRGARARTGRRGAAHRGRARHRTAGPGGAGRALPGAGGARAPLPAAVVRAAGRRGPAAVPAPRPGGARRLVRRLVRRLRRVVRRLVGAALLGRG